MASILVWTTYVVAAVVVVLYGLAAGFVAFLRCAIAAFDTPDPNPPQELCRQLRNGVAVVELHAAQCISNMQFECRCHICCRECCRDTTFITACRRHPGRGQGWGKPRTAHTVLHASCRQRRVGPDTPRILFDCAQLCGHIPDSLELLCSRHGLLDSVQPGTVRQLRRWYLPLCQIWMSSGLSSGIAA